MATNRTILDHIGHTPLLKLNHVTDSPGVDIYVKCEFTNPGGSIKDRVRIASIRGGKILEQLDGAIDGWVAFVGTGGTLLGVAQALKEEYPNLKVVGVVATDCAGKKAFTAACHREPTYVRQSRWRRPWKTDQRLCLWSSTEEIGISPNTRTNITSSRYPKRQANNDYI